MHSLTLPIQTTTLIANRREYLLPIAVKEPNNITARSQMLTASALGATAFQKGLGAIHALAHPLGAVYDAHHGMLNAILMPYVLNHNRPAIKNRTTHLARCLDLPSYDFNGFITWIIELRKELNIPNTLKDIGIDDNQLDKISAMAVEDPSAGGNPISLSVDDYRTIFGQAIQGLAL